MNRTLILSLILTLSAACSGGSTQGPFTDVASDPALDGKDDGSRASRERTPELPKPSIISTSKHAMSEALRQIGSANGPAIEAKFELDDAKKLSLSIYPVGKGIDTDPENNVFQELAGDPTAASFSPELSVFADQEHLTRSARDLTLVQMSAISLLDAVDAAEQYGDVYWAVPAISAGRAGYNVYLLAGGKAVHGFIDGEGSSESYAEEIGKGPGAGASDQRTPELGDDLSIVRTSQISMSDALKKSEARYGKTIEAKFELGDDGKLSLSIYPVKTGATINAEKAVFQELSGDPTGATFTPGLETFAADDFEHLTRSSRDLTLVQTASLSLVDAVKTAEAMVAGGIVYWAIPTLRDGRSGYGVYVLGADNKPHYLFIC